MAVANAEPLAPQNYTVPNVGGNTLGFNNIGTGGGLVIGPDTQRRTIIFSNPNLVGNINLLIYQMIDANGNALAPTFAAPGGGRPLLPGSEITVTGDCQGAWGAVAQSGVANGLTVTSSRT